MPGQRELPAGHERELGHAVVQPGQGRRGLRALQREQSAVGQRLHVAAVADVRDQVLDVGVLARRVHDQEQVGLAPRDHQVVEDAAVGVGEEGVSLLAGDQVDDIDRHERFERARGVVADQAQLAHVRHVEQCCRLAAVLVLGNDAAGVVDRHLVAGELDHLGAEFEVQRVERGLQEFGCGHAHLRGHFGPTHSERVGDALSVRFT
jgi:hypothetical protein